VEDRLWLCCDFDFDHDELYHSEGLILTVEQARMCQHEEMQGPNPPNLVVLFLRNPCFHEFVCSRCDNERLILERSEHLCELLGRHDSVFERARDSRLSIAVISTASGLILKRLHLLSLPRRIASRKGVW
jgi:hypothetical protein